LIPTFHNFERKKKNWEKEPSADWKPPYLRIPYEQKYRISVIVIYLSSNDEN
jgi:hypothetical protein